MSARRRAGAAVARRLALAALLVPLAAAAAAEPAPTRVGRATDPDTGATLYLEVHHENFVDGRMVGDHVVYVDPHGHPFADKQVDFGHDPLLPEFLLENHRTGQIEGARPTGHGLLVRYRERRGTQTERTVVEPPHGAVDDAGFDRFIARRFDALAGGEVERMSFLVPSRHEFLAFRIQRADSAGADTVDFVMEPDSVLLRLLVAPIHVRYDRASRRLLRYVGLSNLRDASGDNPRVRIDFRYGAKAATAQR